MRPLQQLPAHGNSSPSAHLQTPGPSPVPNQLPSSWHNQHHRPNRSQQLLLLLVVHLQVPRVVWVL